MSCSALGSIKEEEHELVYEVVFDEDIQGGLLLRYVDSVLIGMKGL